jgi:hypothetical protein
MKLTILALFFFVAIQPFTKLDLPQSLQWADCQHLRNAQVQEQLKEHKHIVTIFELGS